MLQRSEILCECIELVCKHTKIWIIFLFIHLLISINSSLPSMYVNWRKGFMEKYCANFHGHLIWEHKLNYMLNFHFKQVVKIQPTSNDCLTALILVAPQFKYFTECILFQNIFSIFFHFLLSTCILNPIVANVANFHSH